MRLAIISDIHEDIASLQAAFKKIEKSNVDETVCLGDISGFSVPYYSYLKERDAHKCLELIRERCSVIVLGNHDIYAARIIPDIAPFFDFPYNWYNLDYKDRKALAKDKIWLHEENDLKTLYSSEDLDYLKTLPEFYVHQTSGIPILFTHYAYPNVMGLKKSFYTYQDEFERHFAFMKKHNCAISFFGHSHVKGFLSVNQKRLKQYNYKNLKIKSSPLGIGIPPLTRHGKRSGFCIFDTDQMKIEVMRI